ncbi:MAG: hypothetical protein PWQ97_886 [Tepidanaerobacteraceae bacterium]|nr:hypothetical protein [Tepidanaerobacteraceae bacterium]
MLIDVIDSAGKGAGQLENHAVIVRDGENAADYIQKQGSSRLGSSSQETRIEMGKDADLVIFDENINISMVMVMGNLLKG